MNIQALPMYYMISITFILMSTVCTNISVPNHFIKQYFNYKNIGILNVISCPNQGSFKLMKYIMNEMPVLAATFDPSAPIRLPFSKSRVGLFVDMHCGSSIEYLLVASKWYMYNSTYSWLIWTNNLKSVDVLRRMSISLNSDVVVSIPGIILYDVYKIMLLPKLEIIKIGSWDPSSGFSELKYKKRNNLNGVTVKGSLVITDLTVDINNVTNQIQDQSYFLELDILNRYHYILHQILPNIYNYKLHVTLTKTWGYKQEIGHFNGMIGHIVNNSADVGLTGCKPRHDRLEVVEFLPSLHSFRLCFIFRQPKAFGTASAVILPLSKNVWLCLGVLTLLCTICLHIINLFEISEGKQTDTTFNYCIILGIGALAQQGFPVSTSRISTKILSLSTLLLGVMVYTYYSGAIVNVLLSPSYNSIQTLEQLVNSNMKLGMVDIPYLNDRVIVKNPLTAKAYKKMMNGHSVPLTLSLANGVRKLRKGGFAFYAEDAILYAEIDGTFFDNEKCDLKEVEMLAPFTISCPIQKYSQLKEILSQGMLKIMETGLHDREDRKWYPQQPNCLGSQNILSVNLEAMTMAFAILISGIVVAFMILLLEKLMNQFAKKGSNKCDNLKTWKN